MHPVGTDDVHAKLDAILEQARLTNGRISRLEEEVFGKPEHHTDGLIRQVAANTQWRQQQQTILTLMKFVVTPSTVLTFLTVLFKAI